jgi:hypothetical protein
MKSLLIATLLFAGLSASAQVRTFNWTDELCEYRGTYDAKKYSPVQLQNTLKLFSPGEFDLSANATVFKFEDIPQLSLTKLEGDYNAKTAALTKLEIVRSPYWESLRQRKLAEIRQVYALARMTIRAYGDPASAFAEKFHGAEKCYASYALPLTRGGDDLLTAWRRVNEDSRTRNGDPERLKRIFEQQYASPERMSYALVEVMGFGWWNCANEAIAYVQYDGSQEKEFKKLFTRVKTVSCDEP